MKFKIILTKIILAIFAVQIAFSQTENVGIGTTTPDNSALLHLDVSAMATKRGLLIPKVTSAQRLGISNPANGLLVYDTDDNRFYYNAGTPGTPNWVAFVATNSTFPFNLLSSGTNTTAAMLVGNGASLAPTGTGFVQANRFVGTGSSSNAVDLATSEVSGILPVANGGTGLSSTPTNGQLLIGNGTGYSLNTVTAGTGISVANGSGSITISADAANISHNSLNDLQLAQSGVTYGHISDQTQTIAGAKTFSSNVTSPTFISTVNTGTSPLTVNSTTLVNNLNADLLDGLNSTNFLQTTSTGNLTTSTTGITITGGTGAVIGSGASINIANADGSNTGLLTSSDWTAFNNKLGSGSAAGGDLSGTYPNPTVDALQGNAVSSATPTNGQVLTWNNTLSQWEPQSPGGSSGWTLTGNTLTGTEFLGSTNNQPLVISTNNTERMRILNNGKILIGTTTEPDDSIRVRVAGDVLIDQDLIVEGNIDLEAIIFKQRTQPPGTATEGMVYYNATEKKLKVHDGTNFQDLTGGPVVVRAYLGSNKSISQTTYTNLVFDSESFDSHNAFSSGTFTAPQNGYYKITLYLNLYIPYYNSSYYYEIQILKNSNTINHSKIQQAPTNTSLNIPLIMDDLVYLNANDVLTIQTKKNPSNATSATIISGSSNSHLTIYLI